MKKTPVEILDFYDEEITGLISTKYGFTPIDSLRRFLNSETFTMLNDAELEMWDFAPLAIFDMWETEQVTGNPRNSVYLR